MHRLLIWQAKNSARRTAGPARRHDLPMSVMAPTKTPIPAPNHPIVRHYQGIRPRDQGDGGSYIQGSASSVSHFANVAAAWYEPRPMAGRHSPAMDGCIAAWGTAPGSQDTRAHTGPDGSRHARQSRLGLCAAAHGRTALAPPRPFVCQQACCPRSVLPVAPEQSPSQASMS